MGLHRQLGILEGFRWDAHLSKPISKEKGFSGTVDMSVVYDQKEFSFDPSELYGRWKSDNWQVSLGRKKEIWSQMDNDWKLGLWQPRFRLNSLRSKNQGLTGLFFVHQPFNNGFRWRVFFSPLFIPDAGAAVTEADGKLQSSSPWFSPPSSTFDLARGRSDIRYRIEELDIKKLVLKTSKAVSAQWGLQYGWLFRAAYALKPGNQTLLSYNAKLKAVENPYVHVNIAARSFEQELLSMDIGYRQPRTSFYLSYFEEKTKHTEILPDYANQIYTPSRGYSATMKWQRWSWLVNLSYMEIFGGQSREEGVSLSEESIFGGRFDYHRPVKLLLGYISGRFYTKTSWIYDFSQKGLTMTTDWHYKVNKSWSLFAGAEILALDSEGSQGGLESVAKDQKASFISTYQDNNRVFTGVNYVF